MKEPEELHVTIPLEYYVTHKPYKFTHNGHLISFVVTGNTPEIQEFTFDGYGKGMNGKKQDLLVIAESDNSFYGRSGLDLVKQLVYQRQFDGMKMNFEGQSVFGELLTFEITLIDGNRYTIENEGLVSISGERGNIIVEIHSVE